jgi:hypothetical protein
MPITDPRVLGLNLSRKVDTEGTIVYPDGPARFERFQLPPNVQNFYLHEGGLAPGVCFSDEMDSFKNIFTALRKKNPEKMVENIKPDPSNWGTTDTDYEIFFSHELMPHPDSFYKHLWKQRHYQQVPVTQGVSLDRSKFPIVKRFLTTVNELKKAPIRLFEWHITAFMIHEFEGKKEFFVIDLNPYLFERELPMSMLRTVGNREDINGTLYAVTNTANLVQLFSNTRDITLLDSTCSVFRFKVPDGVNGNALSNMPDGSNDGVIDSYDIRRHKLDLKANLEMQRIDIETCNALIRNILSWYHKKGIIVPASLDQLLVSEHSTPRELKIIMTINYESIWVQPTEHPVATQMLLDELREYMKVIIPDDTEHEKLMRFIDRFMITGVRT